MSPEAARLPVLLVCLALAALPAANGAGPSGGAGVVEGSLLDVAHPGRIEARHLTELAMRALKAERTDESLSLLDVAVTRDPLLVEAWINRSAVGIRACRPAVARSSAAIARRLDPSSRPAARNHRLAGRLECGSSAAPTEAERAEAALFARPNDPEAWADAARARRAGGARLLAAFHEERALAEGAEGARRRMAGDLASEGLLRSALSALEGLDDPAVEERRGRLRERISSLEPEAAALAEKLSGRLPPDRAEDSVARLASFAEVMLARGRSAGEVREEIEAVLDRVGGQRIVRSWGRLRPGVLWRRVEPPAGRGDWPSLVLRRFPSDTQAAFYLWPGRAWPVEPERVAGRIASGAAVARNGWAACPDAMQGAGLCRRAEIEMALGASRRGVVSLWALGPAEGPPAVAVVGLVGSAGCGRTCREEARADLHALLASFEPGEAAPAEPAPEAWTLPIPPAWQPPGQGDEREAPWRSVGLTDGVVMDLPPGVIGRPLRGGFPEPGGSRRSVLWLRGRFVDREGETVRIGAPGWAGWVDLAPGGGPSIDAWLEGVAEERHPADPGAELVGTASLDEAISRAGGSGRGGVARYRGEAFAGEWLWLQRRVAGVRVDVHLPVAEGAGSLSVLWVALTVRPRGGVPPPALVDLSDRVDVRFARFEGRRSRNDPREGVLLAADLEMAVPRGFRITVSGMSADGFPVKGRHPDGSRMKVERWVATSGVSEAGRRRQAEASLALRANEPWQRGRRARGGRTWEIRGRGSHGPVCAVLVVPDPADSGPTYLLSLSRGQGRETAAWETACELLGDARLDRR